MSFEIEVRNVENVRIRFRRIQATLEDLLPSLEVGMREFGAVEEEIFDSADRGKWQPVSPGTAEYKGSSEVLVRTSRLKGSLTSPQVFSLSPTQIRFGTSVPYAKFHERGFKQVWKFARDYRSGGLRLVRRDPPVQQVARKPVDLTAGDRARIRAAMRNDLLGRLGSD